MQAMNIEESRATPRDEDVVEDKQGTESQEELTGQQRHESLIWR